MMPGRKYSASNSYRYGFNGKENDNEVKGEGNQQDYRMRIYDVRIGKFLSVDPFTDQYAWYSPYQFAGNKPIAFIDLDGAEELDSDKYYSKNRSMIIKSIKENIFKLPAAQRKATNNALSVAISRIKLFDASGSNKNQQPY